jgi:HAD superfamily hydrolase (TIGR01509 family)
MTTPRAVLLDIDGTLVDSNYLHVEAWAHAFREVGAPVDTWRIHRLIGMDSALLLEELLGERVAELGERAKEINSAYYLERTDQLRVFDGARELIADLVERGVLVTLATSAPEDEFEILRRLLDVDRLLTASTSSEDVDTAKPEPDIVHAALDRTGAAAADTIFIGDSRWDAVAASRAGVEVVGVLSGGFGADELVEAGAATVVEDVAALRSTLDSGPLARLFVRPA